MPEIDGLAATAAIRARETSTGSHVPISAMTAEAMLGDRERCLAAGMDGYIAKPVHLAELYQAVEELSRRSGSATAAANTGDTAVIAPDRSSRASALPLDWQQALDQLEGNDALLRHMVQLFLEECPKRLRDIHNAITQANASQLQRAAHTLKGSAGILAAGPVVAAALQLETMGRAGELRHAADAWGALEVAMAQLLPALEALTRGHDA
jgi:CheY-like chemotaxis protein